MACLRSHTSSKIVFRLSKMLTWCMGAMGVLYNGCEEQEKKSWKMWCLRKMVLNQVFAQSLNVNGNSFLCIKLILDLLDVAKSVFINALTVSKSGR
ncbi:hypothetical protein AAG906_020266 [Vitis piasezkii]